MRGERVSERGKKKKPRNFSRKSLVLFAVFLPSLPPPSNRSKRNSFHHVLPRRLQARRDPQRPRLARLCRRPRGCFPHQVCTANARAGRWRRSSSFFFSSSFFSPSSSCFFPGSLLSPLPRRLIPRLPLWRQKLALEPFAKREEPDPLGRARAGGKGGGLERTRDEIVVFSLLLACLLAPHFAFSLLAPTRSSPSWNYHPILAA